ncbi:hypothetical protein LINPERHAP2_LOCUS28602 [Linum perenne]
MHVKGQSLACLLVSFEMNPGTLGMWKIRSSRSGSVTGFISSMSGMDYINLFSPLCQNVTLCWQSNLGITRRLLFILLMI